MAKANEAKQEVPAQEGPNDAPQGDLEAGPEIVRKLTPGEVVGDKLKKLVMEGTVKLPCDLFTLIGKASNLRDGESTFGPWTALLGEFEAMRTFDGSNKRVVSSQCFIPGPAGDLLIAAVRKFVQEEIPVTPEQFKKTGKTYKVTGEIVEMALIIGAKVSDREGGAPYEFTVKPIVPVQRVDSLGALRDRMLKMLPAPAKK